MAVFRALIVGDGNGTRLLWRQLLLEPLSIFSKRTYCLESIRAPQHLYWDAVSVLHEGDRGQNWHFPGQSLRLLKQNLGSWTRFGSQALCSQRPVGLEERAAGCGNWCCFWRHRSSAGILSHIFPFFLSCLAGQR